MSQRLKFSDASVLFNAPLPTHGNRYTRISHRMAIENIRQSLKDSGIGIRKEQFKCTNDGQIATGTFTLDIGDNTKGAMVGFANSYNKKVSFKYGIGANIYVCDNMCIMGSDIAAYRRKHVGNVDVEAFLSFDNHIHLLSETFASVTEMEERMKEIPLDSKEMAELAGRLFIEDQLINATQLGILAGEIQNPSFKYGTKNNTLWDFYQHTTHAAKQFHPIEYLQGHQKLTAFCMEEMEMVG